MQQFFTICLYTVWINYRNSAKIWDRKGRQWNYYLKTGQFAFQIRSLLSTVVIYKKSLDINIVIQVIWYNFFLQSLRLKQNYWVLYMSHWKLKQNGYNNTWTNKKLKEYIHKVVALEVRMCLCKCALSTAAASTVTNLTRGWGHHDSTQGT